MYILVYTICFWYVLVYTSIYKYIQVYTNYKSIYLYIQVYKKIIILIQGVRIPDEKQNNQVHAVMCSWYVLVCASTKFRKIKHVKVCTGIYWYILYTFNFILFRTVSYRFILFHTHTSSYHLIPRMRNYENYIPVLFHTKTLIFRYILVYTGIYLYILLQPGGQDSRCFFRSCFFKLAFCVKKISGHAMICAESN